VLCEVDGLAVALSPEHLRPSGAFIPSTSPQPIDAEITMTLHSPFGDAVLRALVVQVITREQAAQSGRAAGYGVLFLDLADHQRAFIGLTLDALDRAQRDALAAQREAQAAQTRRLTPARARQRIPSSPLEPPIHTKRKRKLSVEGADVLRRLRTELEKLPTRTPFAMLGLEADADAEATRDAFLRISKRCHPHVYARYDSPEINTAATDLFIAYKRAYATARTLARPVSKRPRSNGPAMEALPTASSGAPIDNAPALRGGAPLSPSSPATSSSPAQAPRKAECISAIPSPVDDRPARPSAPPPASPPPAARALAQQLGQQLPPRASIATVQRSAPRDRSAVVPLRASVPTRAPGNPSERPQESRRTFDAEIALGSALKHLASSRFEQAELELEQLCTLRPGHRDSQIWLRVCRARRLKAERKPDLAIEEYRAVLELDPDHREALEHAGRRRKRGGLGGKWFGGDDE
jgi:hypothetical protein